MKPDAHAVLGDQHHIIAGIALAGAAAGELDGDQRVPGINADGNNTALANIGKFTKRGLFHRALLGGKKQFTRLRPGHILLVFIGPGHNTNERSDFFIRLQFQKIGDAPALGSPAHVRNLVPALDIHPAGVREKHQVIMRAGGEQMLDEIVVPGGLALLRRHADDPLAAAALGAVLAHIGALDEAVVRERNDHALIRNEVFNGNLALVGDDFSFARGGVLLPDRPQLRLDDRHHARFLRENIEQILDHFQQGPVFLIDLVDFQTGQLVQAQFENGIHLPLGQGIAPRHQPAFAADQNPPLFHLRLRPFKGQQFDPRLIARLAGADDVNEIVQVGQGNQVPLQQLGALLGLAQFEPRAAQDHLAAMLNVTLDDLLEIQGLGPAMIDGQRIDAEGNLQLRVLKQLGDDDFRRGLPLEFNDQPAMLIRLIAHRGNFRDDLFVDEIGDLLFQTGAIDVERNLGDDQLLTVALHLLDPDAPAQLETALARGKIILNALHAAEKSAGREVRSLDEFHQLRNRNFRLINLGTDAINDFAQIVGRHVRGHAYGDAGAAIDQQIWKRGGKHGRLSEALVVVGNEIHRVLIHVGHQQSAQMGQPRLGITHGRRRVVFDGTEISLAIHEFLAHRPGLGHMHQGGVNHRFAMGMVIAGGIAANLGALNVLAPRKQRQVFHRVEDAPLRGLESVTHVGQGPRDDDGHGIIEKRIFNFVRDIDFGNFFALRIGPTAGARFRGGRSRFDFVWHVLS